MLKIVYKRAQRRFGGSDVSVSGLEAVVPVLNDKRTRYLYVFIAERRFIVAIFIATKS